MSRILCIGLFLALSTLLSAQGYKIKVKIDNYQNDTCILGYRLGKSTYVKDTVIGRNTNNEFVFEDEKTLQGGVYLVLTKPKNTWFEFLVPNEVDQKKLQLHAKMKENGSMSEGLKIKGSKDNQVFLDYMDFLKDLRKRSEPITKKMAAEKNEVEKKSLQMQLEKMGKEVGAHQKMLAQKHPGFLSVNLIMASTQPEVPEAIKGDRAAGFRYYRKHYWDAFDWSDDRLIRTPIFKDKLEFYTNKLCVQVPDSVIINVDFVLQAALKGGNSEMFQYVASELLNKYAKSKVICMDAVYVHIGEKYYCSGKAEWVDSTQLVKICENVQTLKPLRCGLYAPNVSLKRLDGNPVDLYSLKSKFTALYFWDPDCGNCTKVSAKLVPVYQKYKEKGLEVFGVCSKSWKDISKCKNKVADKKMDWINTSDEPYPLAVVKKIYDIQVNPYLILLDENKKIMYKRIDPQQLDDILKREFDRIEKEAKGEK